MIEIELSQAYRVKRRFFADRPGPQVGLHVLATDCGSIYVDRWPDPRALLARTADNYALSGDPAAVTATDLSGLIAGFVEAPPDFLPVLRAAFADLLAWRRIVMQLKLAPAAVREKELVARRITAADTDHVANLSPDIAWIVKTWDGAAGLAASGHAWGAFDGQRLVSVACTFFLGERFEDIGVVTEIAYRGRGAAAACAAALCSDIQARGRIPSWTTSPGNAASLGLAARLGFEHERDDWLFVIGRDVPRAIPPLH